MESPVYGIRDRLLRKGDYINGSFVKPEQVDGYLNAINPGDRSDVLGRFPFSEGSVDEAVDRASMGFRIWRRAPFEDRASMLLRLREGLLTLQDHLAVLITRETGKPLWESRQEVHSTVRLIDVLIEDGLGMIGSQAVEEMGARMDRMPRGVVVVVTPYTMPLLIPTTQTAVSILAGNAVILKPSKFSPGVGQAVAELWDRCHLPRGVFNMLQGSGNVIGQALVNHPGIDMLLFTGSYETAMGIRRSLLDRPELPAVFQCGGKGTAIVLDDAEVERTLYEILVGAFLTAGQRHNGTGRLIVTDAVYDAIVPQLLRRAARLNVGYGFQADTFMGPLISENHRTRYRRFGRLISGSRGSVTLMASNYEKVEDRRGFYVCPAIYRVDWEGGPPFLAEEPPGPTLLIYRVRSWEEAVALHNQGAFRPVTSLFTSLENPFLPEIQEMLRTGALNVNRGTLGTYLRLPRMALGRSSNGFAEGIQLIYTVSYPRTSLLELRPFNPQALVPGVNWESTERAPLVERDEEDETEEDLDAEAELADLSSALEPTHG
jgi:acyl-CoA reductase-like NAD-dependent aldehyde dehydrogenase